jgi:hypothetical protein
MPSRHGSCAHAIAAADPRYHRPHAPRRLRRTGREELLTDIEGVSSRLVRNIVLRDG